jgi:prepilin-type N-terminal cleavage/methylation domain-containing protein
MKLGENRLGMHRQRRRWRRVCAQGKRAAAGFTLPELAISILIAAVVTGGVMSAYVFTAQSAEWSAFNLAAHSLAMQRMEQSRAAKWDLQASPPVDDFRQSDFPPRVEILDIPISGTNKVHATNVTTITDVSVAPPLRMVRVDCSWRFTNGKVFTNTITTYRAPDQ